MGGHLPLFAVPLAGLVLDVAAQLVLCRIPMGIGHVRRQFMSFAAGMAAVAIGMTVLLARRHLPGADLAGYMALHLLTYAFLGFCFFNVINANLGALRVRMLKEYLAQDPEPLADVSLNARYEVGAMLDARLARLMDGRQILLTDGRYRSQPGGVTLIAGIFRRLRRLLLRR